MTTTGADRDAVGGTTRGYWWWERRRGAVLDVGLAVVSAFECGVEGVRFAQTSSLPVPLCVVLGLIAGAVLVVRRRWPYAVVLVSVAVTPAEMGFVLGLVGLYTLAASEAPRRIIAALTGMAFAATFIVTFVRTRQDMGYPGLHSDPWYVPLLAVLVSVGLTAPPVLLGLYVGARRRLMESLRERADSLEQELSLLADRAEQRAEWARTEERTRIAREMHDVVAHRVSLMVVHAAALQAVALKDPPKAVKNAALVGDMGRQALTELREMLGVLRSGEAVAARKAAGAGAGAGAAASPAPASPSGVGEGQGAGAGGERAVPLAAVGAAAAAAAAAAAEDGPCLADIEGLVGQSRDAGMVVELLVQGEVRVCAPEVEQTAYRVVQEALTNVHKHAGGAEVTVRLAYRGAEVAMQVENGPSVAGVADAGLPSGGNGLVGMRERVTALGGVFVSGATDAGGFRVSAVLPDAVAGVAEVRSSA
ncbi:sensor histidine kinase [Streptomyces montanisoli]|uniref:histidine kinase n=1 Tax=Streptomyces montanisoli TaxID=2798581 RepID=A0A940MHB0_9ACTN|nr:histidine kinase [Streptomyces montanisoli]MBP0459211.1 sensor histidine kinase [Streptomyces montanisoli]